jgi:hypothetical protein
LQKPDLVLPSQFAETNGAYPPNVGTSAACALAAGVVTALRSHWDQNKVTPSALNAILRAQATQTSGTGWNARTGHGILNVPAAISELNIKFP